MKDLFFVYFMGTIKKPPVYRGNICCADFNVVLLKLT